MATGCGAIGTASCRAGQAARSFNLAGRQFLLFAWSPQPCAGMAERAAPWRRRPDDLAAAWMTSKKSVVALHRIRQPIGVCPTLGKSAPLSRRNDAAW